ncbi:MAG: transporter substrate-binding domain-containing protein [Oligoflexia bacterium]|nr:transporter substrate-binding domain-containing protein [Oligoflexia bacterium]
MKSGKIIKVFLSFIVIFLAIKLEANVNPPIKVLYFDRTPFYIKNLDNSVSGFLIEITKLILQKAKIQYEFQETPTKRILSMIEKGTEPLISVGWFKNPQREDFAIFTEPIYKNRPQIIIIQKEKAAYLSKNPTMKEILSKRFKLGVIDGFSYGKWVDGEIAKYPQENIFKFIGDPSNSVVMLENNRIDFCFISYEEADYFFSKSAGARNLLTVKQIADAPEGDLRYLMLNKKFDKDLLDKINKAIIEVKESQEYKKIISFSSNIQIKTSTLQQ